MIGALIGIILSIITLVTSATLPPGSSTTLPSGVTVACPAGCDFQTLVTVNDAILARPDLHTPNVTTVVIHQTPEQVCAAVNCSTFACYPSCAPYVQGATFPGSNTIHVSAGAGSYLTHVVQHELGHHVQFLTGGDTSEDGVEACVLDPSLCGP